MKFLVAACFLALAYCFSCAPSEPAKLPESCSKACVYPYDYPAGPDDTGECYCEGHIPFGEDPADEFLLQ